MVDFSLKKRSVSTWRGSLGRRQADSDSTSTFKSSRYQDMKVSDTELPKVSAKERSKAGTMMKRRLSVHQPGNVKVDYDSMPAMPAMPSGVMADEQFPARNSSLLSLSTQQRMQQRMNNSDLYSGKALKQLLSDPSFKAKRFVTERLGDATAVEIDQFTSSLNDLSLEIQDEIKANIDKSFKEILTVNKDLETATSELKVLRTKVHDVKEVMSQFVSMAEKRLQLEQQAQGQLHESDLSRTPSTASSFNGNGHVPSLLPAVKPGSRKDRTSTVILERMWNEQLLQLFKNVEGAHKFITNTPGRHILLDSDNWTEINAATLKPLQKARIFILNDVVLIASPKPSKLQSSNNSVGELTVSKFSPLRELSCEQQSPTEITLTLSNNKQRALYGNRDPEACSKVMETIRQAKDALLEISQAEEDNTRKIRNSYTLLQQERTPNPNREATTSPIKMHGRSRSDAQQQFPTQNQSQNDALLTSITRSMHVRSGGANNDISEVSKKLKRLDDALEDMDLEIGRQNFDLAITKLNHIQTSLKSLYSTATFDESVMVELLSLKCLQRKNVLYNKLTNLLASESSDVSKLKSYMLNLIALNEPVDALEVFLQNRSNFINDLILQIGIIDNVTSFITQIAIIRFQTLRKVTEQYLEVSKHLKRDFTSLLVCWCSEEVDKHFQLMERELSNQSTLSVQAIKMTRKQIDELKNVGMDYVYKLDDFIRRNNNKIH